MNRYWHDLISFPEDAAHAWRTSGWRGVWAEVADRTLHRVFRRGRMLVAEQPLDALPPLHVPDGVEIREIGADELELLRTLVTSRTLTRFSSYMHHGGICLVASRRGDPVGYTWIAGRMLPGIESIPIDLPGDAAYGWALYVKPSERGSGVGSALVAARLLSAQRRGYRRAWRAIRITNRPALRTLEKTGSGTARIVRDVSYLKLLSHFRMRSHDIVA
jgi:GNAT superfamily N-acetyltransferase